MATPTQTDLIPVQIVHINDEKEIAVILEEGSKARFGINLWQLQGHERKSDGLRSWKYRPVENFEATA